MYTSIEMRKRNIIYIRAILSLTILLVGLYNYVFFTISAWTAFTYAFLLVFSNFAFMFVPAASFKGIKLHYLVFLMDISFITVGAFIFTHMNLAFLIAVFLTIFMSALSQSVGLSLLIALVVDAVYIYINYLTGGQSYNFLTDRALLNLPFMFIVALHSSYLAEKANEELEDKKNLERINVLLTKKMASKSGEISALSSFTENLCNSFKQAVIILDTDGIVRVFNAAAEAILGVSAGKVAGMAVKDIDIPRELKDAIMDLQFKKQEIYEKPLSYMRDSAEQSLIATTSFIAGNSGEEMGILCVVKKTTGSGG